MCRTPDEVLALWQKVRTTDGPHATDALRDALKGIAEDIGRGIESAAPEPEDDEDEALDAEFVDPDDPDGLWAQFADAGLDLGLTPEDTAKGFAEKYGRAPKDAEPAQVWAYIAAMREQRAKQDA